MIAFVCPHYSLLVRGRHTNSNEWSNGEIISPYFRKIPMTFEITCETFGCRDNGNGLCRSAWHAICFRQLKEDNFPVLLVNDFDNSLINDECLLDDDKDRYKEARDGDHLMNSFQCADCPFVNIKGRLSINDFPHDDLMLKCICRATLHSF